MYSFGTIFDTLVADEAIIMIQNNERNIKNTTETRQTDGKNTLLLYSYNIFRLLG
jgi:hypothetical protein